MCPSDKELMYNIAANEEIFCYWVSKWVEAGPDTQEFTVVSQFPHL